MIIDPNEEARRRQEEARERLKAKRELRLQRREGRAPLVEALETAQAALDAFDQETAEQYEALAERQEVEAEIRRDRAGAVAEYNAAIREGLPVLRDADPRPGMMTREEEDAQGRIVSAFLALGIDEISEFDEYGG